MAVDDVTIVLEQNMAQNDTSDRQPGSGVEEMFLSSADVDTAGSAPAGGVSINLRLIDGTNNDAQYFQNSDAGTMASMYYRGKFMADNTNYFRVFHAGATTGDYGFAVIAVG